MRQTNVIVKYLSGYNTFCRTRVQQFGKTCSFSFWSSLFLVYLILFPWEAVISCVGVELTENIWQEGTLWRTMETEHQSSLHSHSRHISWGWEYYVICAIATECWCYNTLVIRTSEEGKLCTHVNVVFNSISCTKKYMFSLIKRVKQGHNTVKGCLNTWDPSMLCNNNRSHSGARCTAIHLWPLLESPPHCSSVQIKISVGVLILLLEKW